MKLHSTRFVGLLQVCAVAAVYVEQLGKPNESGDIALRDMYVLQAPSAACPDRALSSIWSNVESCWRTAVNKLHLAIREVVACQGAVLGHRPLRSAACVEGTFSHTSVVL